MRRKNSLNEDSKNFLLEFQNQDPLHLGKPKYSDNFVNYDHELHSRGMLTRKTFLTIMCRL